MNSIIDQQRDNADFQFRRSVYNGKTFMRNPVTGEMPKEFYLENVKKLTEGVIETIELLYGLK